jgi:hypothetical protein
MISFSSSGDFSNLERFLARIQRGDLYSRLSSYGDEGVAALAKATPKDTGKTAQSWSYEIKIDKDTASIIWGNDEIIDGRPIAILLQYGHGTGTGGYVSGRDYINPTLRPIFDRIANDVWKEVTSA